MDKKYLMGILKQIKISEMRKHWKKSNNFDLDNYLHFL